MNEFLELVSESYTISYLSMFLLEANERTCFDDEQKEYLKLYSVYCAKSIEIDGDCEGVSEEASLCGVLAGFLRGRDLDHSRVQKRSHANHQQQEVHQAPQCHKQDINSFLIKPIQRLCKYPLLIRVQSSHSYDGKKQHPTSLTFRLT